MARSASDVGVGRSPGLAGSPPTRRSLAGDIRRLAGGLHEDTPGAGSASSSRHGGGQGAPRTSPSDGRGRSGGLQQSLFGQSPMTASAPQLGSGGLSAQGEGHRTASNGGSGGYQPAERVTAALAELRGARDADRRRLTQLERRVEAAVGRLEEGAGRERWAETQGSVNGLMEDMTALRQRVEGLDARLWSRTGGSGSGGGGGADSGVSGQRVRELEAQIQSFEHQMRMANSALEEAQRRQVTKLRRVEQATEDATRRVAAVEEEIARNPGELRTPSRGHGSGGLEARIHELELQREDSEAQLQELCARMEDGLAAMGARDMGAEVDLQGLEAATRTTERSLAVLDRRSSGQIQELSATMAALRVKVDGQLQRLGTLAERLETAHTPALDCLRSELAQCRHQDQQRLESELASMRNLLQGGVDLTDESASALRRDVHKLAAELRAELRAVRDRPPDRAESSGAEAAKAVPPPMHPPPAVAEGSVEPPALEDLSMLQVRQGGSASSDGDDAAESPAGGEASQDWWAARLQALTGHLRAADHLAGRVAVLERQFGSTSGDVSNEVSGADSAPPSARPAPAEISALAREVSLWQASLLDSQLELRFAEASSLDGGGGMYSDEDGEDPLAQELEELEARVSAAERLAAGWEQDGDISNGNLGDGECYVVGDSGCSDEAGLGPAEQLALLAERLLPLEDAFRLLAQHLGVMQNDLGLEASGETQASASPTAAHGPREAELKLLAEKVWSGHDKELMEQVRLNVGEAKDAVAALGEQVHAVERRLHAAEEVGDQLKEDVEKLSECVLQQPAIAAAMASQVSATSWESPTIDTSSLGPRMAPEVVSPLAPVRGKLDYLHEQVAKLQLRFDHVAADRPAASGWDRGETAAKGRVGRSPRRSM